MFVFVVPFKSKAVSTHWEEASRLCERAIGSMLADPSPDIRVILVCSEAPDHLPADARLIVKSVSLPTPSTQYEKMTDKYLKNKAGLAAAREFAPAWIMIADADDLISRRLVGFINGQKPNEFWYSQYGWRYSLGSKFVIRLPNFHRFCGTSSVNYVTQDELPKSIDDPMKPHLLSTPHSEIVESRKKNGIVVHPIPFPTTIYVVNSGENWSGNWSLRQHDRRTRIKTILNMRPITSRLRREFGLDHHGTTTP